MQAQERGLCQPALAAVLVASQRLLYPATYSELGVVVLVGKGVGVGVGCGRYVGSARAAGMIIGLLLRTGTGVPVRMDPVTRNTPIAQVARSMSAALPSLPRRL